MFFKRNEGQFRETDRVTRFKLIKSGKHWLRASTSLFGLFKVIRGGVDTAQVSTEIVEECSSTPLTGIDVLKGIVAAGSVIGGGAIVQTQVYANEQTAVEKVIDTDSTLVNTDKVVLGTVGKENQETPASDVTSQSISESVSVSESQSLSESLSSSVSASTSASESASISVSTSTSASTSASTSTSTSESLTRSESLSETSSTSSVVTSSTSKSATDETSKVEEVVADKDSATITYKSTPANLNTTSVSAGVSDKVNGNSADMLTTVATGVVTATETDKKRAEQEKKLKSLSDEIGTYLGRLGNREGAETALLKGNATIEAIQNALTDPNADLNTLISEATRTRNTVVNTVLRASSGARDYRNGQALTSSNDLRIPYNTNASLGNATYNPRAKLVVTNKNQANYFKTSGTANLSGGTVTLTQNIGGQAGSYTLKTKIDMTESFTLTGKINLGNAYEGFKPGHAGGDGIAAVFSTAEPGVIGNAGTGNNGSGGSLGMGGNNLKGSFGFKLDTWHNTSRPQSIDKVSADPGSVGGGGAFGGFIYNYNGSNAAAQGSVYPVIRTFSKLNQNPTDNSLKDYTVTYDGRTKEMTVTYNGQTWYMDLRLDRIALSSDQNVQGRPDTNNLKNENKNRTLLSNAGNPEELALAIFASTGSGTNLQQFRLERFEYSARGAYVTVNFIDADTGEEIPGKDEVLIQELPGTTVDLSQYLNIDGYQLKATNVATARGFVSGNKVRVLEGNQGITYAFHKIKQNELYNATTKVPTVYAVQGETTADLANVNNFLTINPVDSSTSAVTGHRISWLTPISTSATGAQTAQARVTYSDNSTSDVTINYTVYPKVETKTYNGVTGKFYAFKSNLPGDRVTGNGWANNIGGTIEQYTNLGDSALAGTKWSYKYKINNQGAEIVTPVGTQRFKEVWNTTDSDAKSHSTTYTVVATYPNGRYGAVSSSNPALTSETSFDYTVVDPVVKQDYVTTAGDKAPLADIIANPGNTLKNSTTNVTFPSGTTYSWDQTPDDATVANPGFYTRNVRITLPQGSYSGALGNNRPVPVIIKVNPQAPQIADNQVTNTGGLPNKGITVTNVTPGALVTLTLNGHTFPKTAGNNDTSVTFTATDLKAAYDGNNGLLPTGDVTVKQSKTFTNPSTNVNETLESTTITKTITKETVAPEVNFELYIKNNKTNSWEKQTIKDNVRQGIRGYEVFAGDEIKVVLTAKDNSGKIKTLKLNDGTSDISRIFQDGYSSDDTASGIKDTITTASTTNPKVLEYTATYGENVQYKDGNKWTRGTNATDLSDNTGRVAAVVAQGKLNEKFPGAQPDNAIPVVNPTALTNDERTKILAAVKIANPQAANRISDYSIATDGTVTITYKDGTTNTVAPKVKYGVEKVADTFYAVSNETLANLTPANFVRAVGAQPLPTGTTVSWKKAPTFEAGDHNGSGAAVLTVTHPDGSTTDLSYNYKVYPKVETKTHNGVTGKFYAFKSDLPGDKVTGGEWANNIGGTIQQYTNLGERGLSGIAKWSYKYRVNNQGAEIVTPVGTQLFHDVWNTTGSDAKSHSTTYTVIASYPNGRFGTVSSSNPALTSETSFDYTVVDPVAKQEYVTTVGNKTPLADIIANPGEALKNSNTSVSFPTGTTFSWVQAPDDAMVANAGVYTRKVKVTLPQGSYNGDANSRTVDVTIKVNPQAPAISVDST
ncbi:accessory Sec-dependent serine-rich glycoprotein adhesin, partial [Streptococcus sp. HMSC074B11]|uniref:accessory Sec-dependent serine-rich glycoprotein adhesin n=1 Tax=Streptococcus sp. HMSC074B11 TaxID=1715098 RepID=UPI0011D09C96